MARQRGAIGGRSVRRATKGLTYRTEARTSSPRNRVSLRALDLELAATSVDVDRGVQLACHDRRRSLGPARARAAGDPDRVHTPPSIVPVT